MLTHHKFNAIPMISRNIINMRIFHTLVLQSFDWSYSNINNIWSYNITKFHYYTISVRNIKTTIHSQQYIRKAQISWSSHPHSNRSFIKYTKTLKYPGIFFSLHQFSLIPACYERILLFLRPPSKINTSIFFLLHFAPPEFYLAKIFLSTLAFRISLLKILTPYHHAMLMPPGRLNEKELFVLCYLLYKNHCLSFIVTTFLFRPLSPIHLNQTSSSSLKWYSKKRLLIPVYHCPAMHVEQRVVHSHVYSFHVTIVIVMLRFAHPLHTIQSVNFDTKNYIPLLFFSMNKYFIRIKIT